MISVTVWNEFIHEKESEEVKRIYPNGIHEVIADFLRCDDISVRCATLDDEECGLTQDVVDSTDVMIWWGHCAHDKVPDEIAKRVQEAVLKGMGIIFLHSAHMSKPFHLLMGTSGTLGWHVDGDKERVWVCAPSSPIAKGLGRYFELPYEETYTEPFDIPEPDRLVFVSWFASGEIFRSGCCYNRGRGKVFYFQPGHETYPTYYIPEVRTVIRNAVRWAAPEDRIEELVCPKVDPVEPCGA